MTSNTDFERILQLFQTGEAANIKLGLALAKSQKIDLSGFMNELLAAALAYIPKQSANPQPAKLLEKTQAIQTLDWRNKEFEESFRLFYQVRKIELEGEAERFGIFTDAPNLREVFLYNRQRLEYPHELSKLRQLEHIRCYRCRFEELPASIGDLEQLRTFFFASGGLQVLPDTLSKLPQLKHLSVEISPLRTLPESLAESPALTYLNVGHSKMEAIPAFIGRMPKLETLILTENPIREVPDIFGGCTSLQLVRLSQCPLETPPYALLEAPNLKEITLGYMRFEPAQWADFLQKAEARGVQVHR